VKRALAVLGSTVATIVLVLSFLFIPLSLVTQEYGHAVIEVLLAGASLWYVARVMRADRRDRRAAEALLPPERRPARRVPRQPITFQVRETLVAMGIWFALVFAFNALVLGLGAAANIGIAFFAAFMLATLTVTGRHMMFRLTREEDDPR
jgi:predicted Co/Zn/Cd cation transporter (cation efflux family)